MWHSGLMGAASSLLYADVSNDTNNWHLLSVLSEVWPLLLVLMNNPLDYESTPLCMIMTKRR